MTDAIHRKMEWEDPEVWFGGRKSFEFGDLVIQIFQFHHWYCQYISNIGLDHEIEWVQLGENSSEAGQKKKLHTQWSFE